MAETHHPDAHDRHHHRKHHHGRRHYRAHLHFHEMTEPAHHHKVQGGPVPKQPTTSQAQLSDDDLNRLLAGHSFTSEADERAFLASINKPADHPSAAAQPRASSTNAPAAPAVAAAPQAPDASNIIGHFQYSFTVGSDRIPHVYAGTVLADQQVQGQVYQNQNGRMVPASLPEVEVEQMDKYARIDAAAAHSKNPNSIANTVMPFSQPRIEEISGKYGEALDKLIEVQKNQEGAQQIEKILNNQPAFALDIIHNHPDFAQNLLSGNPELVKVVDKYRGNHADTPLSKALGQLEISAHVKTAESGTPSPKRYAALPTL